MQFKCHHFQYEMAKNILNFPSEIKKKVKGLYLCPWIMYGSWTIRVGVNHRLHAAGTKSASLEMNVYKKPSNQKE